NIILDPAHQLAIFWVSRTFQVRVQSQVTVDGHGGNPTDINTEGLCLLSLNGSSVRGLSSLYILKQIMNRVNHERRESRLDAVKSCEILDLIGGTSTGGCVQLIAIILNRLGMDVDECISAYTELMRTVFEYPIKRIKVNWRGSIQSKFDSDKLKEAIVRVINNCGFKDNDLFCDKKERGCKCYGPRNNWDYTLQSYPHPEEPPITATICQAALVPSAATTFFAPVSIGARTVVDGTLGANNPVVEV
ncbi:FabD/lysophospholipase-like protein, partial [Penicillium robsamsonii]|uniref:FabD/lysophospholipase-like protein n=1 Tax=Penicillium robsamsonii TaxID=1792511 RepID=UPI00254765E3